MDLRYYPQVVRMTRCEGTTGYPEMLRDMVYVAGDKAYLRVTPLRGTHRFGVKGKLAPRYVGPFNIL